MARIQYALKLLGVFLGGACVGIFTFMLWAEHQGHLSLTPSFRIILKAGMLAALLLTCLPWLLAEIIDGATKWRQRKG